MRRLSDPKDTALVAALDVIEALVRDDSPGASLRQAPLLAEVEAETLERFALALIEVRQQAAAQLATKVGQLRDAYRLVLSAPALSAASPEPASGGETAVSLATRPGTMTIEGRDGRGRRARLTRPEPARDTSGMAGFTLQVELVENRAEEVEEPLTISPSIEDAVAWAARNQPDTFSELHALTVAHAPAPLAYTNAGLPQVLSHVLPKVAGSVGMAKAALHAFKENMKVEPVGRLHLERLEMTPVGVERGELVSSIPLTPKETVNITHREWSITAEEYESIVKDYFEGYSEQGVAEKTDVAQSTENQSRHTSTLSFGAAASASYLGVTLSSSFGYNAGSNDETARKDSRNHSVAATRRASARTRKDKKVSFRVSSVVGTEDAAVRVITNPSDTKAMRVDYYQLMRKWRVDLYRYGLRMTYDIVIPSPGADLIRKVEELRALDARIDAPFEFALKPEHVTRQNWTKLAAAYQATFHEVPPPAEKWIMQTTTFQRGEDEVKRVAIGTVELDVDTDYEVTSAEVTGLKYFDGEPEPPYFFDVLFDDVAPQSSPLFRTASYYGSVWGLLNRNGRMSIPFAHVGVNAGGVTVRCKLTLRSEVFQAWRFRAWSALRQGAWEQYQESRQRLRDQRASLATEIAPFDALTLRRMELEEIEKGVLRWLFGPSFNMTPADIQKILNQMAANDPLKNDALDTSTLSHQQWQRMLEFGEFIKYVQQAIEWENVLYFTYPYFWDTPANWSLKQFLQHPDALHRTFLRAGCARVVITIRPGFEKSFAQLVESGSFGSLPGDHPYVSIAEEIQNYAKTNYPGIPPANPANPPKEEEVNAAERGLLQATWWEYTPTSALDVSLNTSLPELA
ncbi:hypothetical protein [Myxococcus sp. RHSTA-1-4]|uniref:hypothetical protein n=1 Tax=Myxococcus sp. RHSTA-1-4 TaxID=2874601 RepID=UPI001CBE7D87|nr:hypothetical protein [Myxococcus sp. RHSTA-1-4]MBZ4415375.1 hypothetical protein [Myxococcus sp. RHSTA-1-4]